MMSDREKVSAILDKYGLTAAQFADSIGIPRSSISHILSERNRLSLDIARKVVGRYPEITFEWLCNDNSQPEALFQPRQEVAEKPGRRTEAARRKMPDFQEMDLPVLSDGRQLERIMLIFSDRSFKEFTVQPQ